MSDENNKFRLEEYTSSFGVNFNAYEFVMTFGRTDLNDVDHIHHVASLRMSPQHAKSVLILLERFVKLYEEQISPIGMPKELLSILKGEDETVNNEPN